MTIARTSESQRDEILLEVFVCSTCHHRGHLSAISHFSGEKTNHAKMNPELLCHVKHFFANIWSEVEEGGAIRRKVCHSLCLAAT